MSLWLIPATVSLMIASLLFIAALTGIVPPMTVTMGATREDVGILPIALVIGMFGVFFLVIAVVVSTRRYRDINLGQVDYLEGIIKLNISNLKYLLFLFALLVAPWLILIPLAPYSVKIGGRTFRIKRNLLLSLRDGDYYTAYYAPKSGTLLAIEPSLPLEQVKGKRKLTLGDDGELLPLDELADGHANSAVQSRNE